MKRETFKFYVLVRDSKKDQEGMVNLFGRITINGKRSEFSLKTKIKHSEWDFQKGQVKGRSQQANQMRKFIDTLTFKVQENYRLMIEEGIRPDPIILKERLFSQDRNLPGVLEFYEIHNQDLLEGLNVDVAEATINRHKISARHFSRFLSLKFKTKELPFEKLTPQVIKDYFYYFRKMRNCSQNTSLKYLRNFKKITNLALKRKIITDDPFREFNFKFEKVEKPFLTKEELKALVDTPIFMPPMELVRDVFVFCCFTGLAYVDVSELKEENVVLGIDGGKWIRKARHKSDVVATIPLLPVAEKILEKYEDHPNRSIKGTLLPVFSNQKMNAFLKEIASICKIEKDLTTHVARHTFATTVTLANHVSMEAVSKMLGHSSLEMTKEYAKIVDEYLSEEVQKLKGKFE